MKKKLIVNADGFGFTPGVNKGIIESISNGVVKSVSCNVNFPYINEVEKLIKEFPFLSIGIHLNLSVGKPVSNSSKIHSLLSENGEFWGNNPGA